MRTAGGDRRVGEPVADDDHRHADADADYGHADADPTTATPTPTPTTATPTPTATTPTATASAATSTAAASSAGASTSAEHAAVLTADIVKAGAAATTAPVTLCVEVVPSVASTARGDATKWALTAWATGGDVAAVTISLQTSPAGIGTPVFSAGCATDGTSSCSLGAVDSTAAKRQLTAQFTVPVTSTTVSSASLTAVVSATNLATALEPSGSMVISAASASASASPGPIKVSSSSVTSLPAMGAVAPTATLSPGGSASGLFPTVNPSSTSNSTTTENAKQVADTSSLTGTASPTGAELTGLGALALAVVLAVTRLSIRRPAPAGAAAAATATSPEAKSPGPEGPDTAIMDVRKPNA
jgi:hypothetical protein